MKKRTKYFIIPLVTALMCLSLALPFLNIFSVSPTKADYFYTILDSGMFTEEVDVDAGDAVSNHTLNCYRIKNYDTFIAVS